MYRWRFIKSLSVRSVVVEYPTHSSLCGLFDASLRSFTHTERMQLLTLCAGLLGVFVPALAITAPAPTDGHWVDIWTSMPQLTEAANLPNPPFVRLKHHATVPHKC